MSNKDREPTRNVRRDANTPSERATSTSPRNIWEAMACRIRPPEVVEAVDNTISMEQIRRGITLRLPATKEPVSKVMFTFGDGYGPILTAPVLPGVATVVFFEPELLENIEAGTNKHALCQVLTTHWEPLCKTVYAIVD